ncbi:MAG: PrgI family protein [Anaerolineae bacterium]|nr:PrgI family protein [Anaerolineae bacterium]
MIRFPRRLHLGFRPWYGLTLRQLGYLLFAAMLAGLVILSGPARGVEFVTRIVLGLLIIGLGVALAFFRWNGMTLERWIVARVRFLFRPQRRVWTRGEGRRMDVNADLRYDEAPSSTPPPQPAAEASPQRARKSAALPLVTSIPKEAVIIFADLTMIVALFALTLYLKDGGWTELASWYINFSTR